MTPEQRLDRLERIVKLLIRAGMRGRQHMRELDEKAEILIHSQMQHDEMFRLSEDRLHLDRERVQLDRERLRLNVERLDLTEKRLNENYEKLSQNEKSLRQNDEKLRENEEQFRLHELRFNRIEKVARVNKLMFSRFVRSRGREDQRLERLIRSVEKGRA